MATSSVVIPVGNYSSGTTTFGAVTAPAGTTTISFLLDRTLWSSSSVGVAFLLEICGDSGVTWQALAAATAVGGSVVPLPGQSAPTTSGVAATVAPPLPAGVLVRGSMTVANGTIHTSGTLTFS